MSLNEKQYHRTIRLLIAIIAIGLISLTVAILVTYVKNYHIKICRDSSPVYSSADFSVYHDEYGSFMESNGFVKILDSDRKKIFCLGALINESVVLINYVCFEKFKNDFNETMIEFYDESSEELFAKVAVQRNVIDYEVNDDKLFVLLYLDHPMDSHTIIKLPKIQECTEVNKGNATFIYYNRKLYQNRVEIMKECLFEENFLICTVNLSDNIDLFNGE